MKKSLFLLLSICYLSVNAQNSYVVNTVGNTFSSDSLTINIGDTVTFNSAAGSHNVNATLVTFPNNPEGFGNGVTSAPWSFQWIFSLDGTYDYQCDPHAGLGMIGIIIVNPIPLAGCTDTLALNFDSLATIDDGSCTYPLPPHDNLFFSEYGEGSSNNKYFEIYNPTNDTIDLTNYAFARVSNSPRERLC